MEVKKEAEKREEGKENYKKEIEKKGGENKRCFTKESNPGHFMWLYCQFRFLSNFSARTRVIYGWCGWAFYIVAYGPYKP